MNISGCPVDKMTNSITASVEFFFKGEKFTATIELDLDQHMRSSGKLPRLYPLLASSINLDLYSYEYEMMQVENITFSNAKGLATEHIIEGVLDVAAFENSWHESKQLEKCQQIAHNYLDINDLQQHPKLKSALLEAYRMGTKTQ